MKKIILFSIIIFLFFGCKSKEQVIKRDFEKKNNVETQKDSVKNSKENTSLAILDDTFSEIEIVDFYYSVPDTNKNQYVTRKIETKIDATGKKTVLSQTNKNENLAVSEKNKDKTTLKEKVQEKIKEEIKMPFNLMFILTVALVFVLIFFGFKIYKTIR